MCGRILAALLFVLSGAPIGAQTQEQPPGAAALARYFRHETTRLQKACLAQYASRQQWEQARPALQHQLLDMLGLDPLPAKTPLQAMVTGSVEADGFRVDNVHFQSRPGLYVTGNLYLPAHVERPVPAVLYLCGHAGVKKGDVSFGNKVSYQHHGAWLARNGFVCLTIDSLQLGEIEGIHHGMYRYDRWWWLNRGYTPAGVEAWNCVRALDYLCSRPEVDSERLGVTGRSGGGAYSWWIAAIDQRVDVAVPVAGITDLQNHVVDGCVEGHCDCMYVVNTYRWDYPAVAALVAPRPLLISNTDRDRIFPLDGVVRTHALVRNIYELSEAADQLALNITAGPHQDTQELQVPAFRWLNQHLRNDDSLIEGTGRKYFEPEQLKVFTELPTDQINTTIDECFVPLAEVPTPPESLEAWKAQRGQWMRSLSSHVFGGWPKAEQAAEFQAVSTSTLADGWKVGAATVTTQPGWDVPLLWFCPPGKPRRICLDLADQQHWRRCLATAVAAAADSAPAEWREESGDQPAAPLEQLLPDRDSALVVMAARGVGPTRWSAADQPDTQIQRRFYLLGQTVDGMRVLDVCRTQQAVRRWRPENAELIVRARGPLAGVALYAALYDPPTELQLEELPTQHRQGPYLLNVSRFLAMPQTLAMALEQTRVTLAKSGGQQDWGYAERVAGLLQRPEALQYRSTNIGLGDDR